MRSHYLRAVGRLISHDCCWYCVNFIVAFPCWSKLFCGQIWYVPAITAGPWWRGMLHSNCSAEALPQTLSLFLSITWLLCILSDCACTHLKWGCGGVGPLYNCPRCIWMTSNVSTLEHLSAFKFLSGRWLCMPPSLSNRVCPENLQHFHNLFQDLCFLFFPYLQSSVIWTDTAWSSFVQSPTFDWFLFSIVPVQPQHCQALASRSVTAGWSCICLWIAAGRGDFILAHRGGGLLCPLDELLTASYESQSRQCTWTSFLLRSLVWNNTVVIPIWENGILWPIELRVSGVIGCVIWKGVLFLWLVL